MAPCRFIVHTWALKGLPYHSLRGLYINIHTATWSLWATCPNPEESPLALQSSNLPVWSPTFTKIMVLNSKNSCSIISLRLKTAQKLYIIWSLGPEAGGCFKRFARRKSGCDVGVTSSQQFTTGWQRVRILPISGLTWFQESTPATDFGTGVFN